LSCLTSKELSLDQEEILVVEGHMSECNQYSEKTIISLNERLKPYTYDKGVRVY
jgi:hypothetical protein